MYNQYWHISVPQACQGTCAFPNLSIGNLSKVTNTMTSNDDDLDDLDDYLDDIADEILDKPFKSASTEDTTPPVKVEPQNDITQEELTKQIDENMSALFGEQYKDPKAKEQLTKMMDQLAQNFDVDNLVQKDGETLEQLAGSLGKAQVGKSSTESKEPQEGETEFSKIMASTMKRLKEQNSKVDQSIKEEQQKQKSPEDLLADLMQEFSLDGAGEGDFDITKSLADMVLKLTTKEMLYDPMKNLTIKYPKWLEENQEKASKEDLERYQAQNKYVHEIIELYENPTYDDNNPQDREEVSIKLEALQAAGLPPQELMEDFPNANPGMNFNPEEFSAGLPEVPECDQQ